MLGPWFATSSSHQIGADQRPQGNIPPAPPSRRASEKLPSGGAHARPHPTPHDEILATLLGQGPVASTTSPELEDGKSPEYAASGGPTGSPPYASTTPAISAPLYDPFSGALLGVLIPPTPTPAPASAATTAPTPAPPPPPSPPPPGNEELWTHLSRILELQSEIAGMHVQMEALESRARPMPRPQPTVPRRSRHARGAAARGERDAVDGEGDGVQQVDDSAGGGVSDESGGEEDGEDEEEADEEAETKKARDEEFARLADKFTGRKDAIDRIMYKLDDLSSAVTTFHALETPNFDLQTHHPSWTTTTLMGPPDARERLPHRSMTAPTALSDMADFPPPPASAPTILNGAPPLVIHSPLLLEPGKQRAVMDSPTSISAPPPS